MNKFRIFKEHLSLFSMHSPIKSKKFIEPTISSIRKAKISNTNTESSLSSRSISKDKNSTPLQKRIKQAKYISKSRNCYEDYSGKFNRYFLSI
jgi:hypothetical protein